MADVPFVPMTKEGKGMFRRYLSLKEKFLEHARKAKDAHEACNNAQTYRLQLCNRGLDPNSEIFTSLKVDQRLITVYLEIMDRNLQRISAELDLLYRYFLSSPKLSVKPFDDKENTIVRLFDYVSDAESKCMQRRQRFVSCCLDALNNLDSRNDFFRMLL